MPTPQPQGFAFERLEAYHQAIHFLTLTANLTTAVPRGNGAIIDQLRRAALSIPVNIAEGVGRSTLADRRRHYAIARGSAMECAAIVEACRVLELGPLRLLEEGREVLIRVVRLLNGLCG